jgi:hypothetical protein
MNLLKRSVLKKAKRENLERLARFLKLSFDASWSKKHLVDLIRWRITRGINNRH